MPRIRAHRRRQASSEVADDLDFNIRLRRALLLVAAGALLILGGLAVWLVGRLTEPAPVETRPGGLVRRSTRRVSTAAWTAPAAPGADSSPRWSERPVCSRCNQPPARPVVEAAYRKLAALHHPDKGGDEELMKRLNRARDLPLQPR
jgi:hypothetical protein